MLESFLELYLLYDTRKLNFVLNRCDHLVAAYTKRIRLGPTDATDPAGRKDMHSNRRKYCYL